MLFGSPDTLRSVTDREREREREWGRGEEERGLINLSAGDERWAGEERGVMSSPRSAKRGDRETLAVCAQHPDLHTHYYIYIYIQCYNQTHTPTSTDFEVTLWRASVSTG